MSRYPFTSTTLCLLKKKILFIKDKYKEIKPEDFFDKFDYSFTYRDKALSDYLVALTALLNDNDVQVKRKANKLISEFKVTSLCKSSL